MNITHLMGVLLPLTFIAMLIAMNLHKDRKHKREREKKANAERDAFFRSEYEALDSVERRLIANVIPTPRFAVIPGPCINFAGADTTISFSFDPGMAELFHPLGIIATCVDDELLFLEGITVTSFRVASIDHLLSSGEVPLQTFIHPCELDFDSFGAHQTCQVTFRARGVPKEAMFVFSLFGKAIRRKDGKLSSGKVIPFAPKGQAS